jgi:hypothetical protein
MNEFSSRSRSTVAAVHQVIADMWPDDHDAMLAFMERRAASSRDPGDHDSALISVEPRPSSLSD